MIKNTCLHLFLLISLASCFGGSEIRIKNFAKNFGKASANVSSVSIVNDQLIINGSSLDGVTGVRVTGPSSFDHTFAIESQSSGNLVANGLSALAFAMDSTFNLILTDAEGAASFPVTFTLVDGSVTAQKLDQMGAGIGQVLKWNGTTWVASDLGGLTYAGNWHAGTNTPDLLPGGNAGEYYIVNNAGSTNLGGGPGTNSWAVGDWVVWNDVSARWEKIDNATNVTSFNGRNGAVSPQSGDYTWAEINKTTSALSDIANVEVPTGDGSDTGKVLKWNNATSTWEISDDLSGGGAGSVTSTEIANGSIVDADVNASAAIAQSKINGLTTDLAARLPLAGGTMTGDITFSGTQTFDGIDVSNLSGTVGTQGTSIAANTAAITGLDTDDVSEATNLYFTTARARTAAVLNTTAGTETDQAPSVAAMKSYVSGLGTGDILDGGNTEGAAVTIGTNDAQSLNLETNNSTAMTILNGGNVGIGTTAPAGFELGTGSKYFEVQGGGSSEMNIDSLGNSVNHRPALSFSRNGTRIGYIRMQKSNTSITDGDMEFATHDGTSLVERMVIAKDGNVGIGVTIPDTLLEIAGTLKIADGGETCTLAGEAGMIRYNTGNLEYCNGSAWQTLGVSGSGLTNFNGETGGTQTLAVGTTGTAPAFVSGTNTHTLNIPLASGAGVTSGTISKTDYDSFAAKQAAITTGTTAQYLRGDLSLSTFGTDVLGSVLTGYSAGPGTVAATDTVLQALQKLDGNVAAISVPSNTDGLSEGSTNLYFTNLRARTAAVLNTTAGTETDQAPSVAAMKSYVTANNGASSISELSDGVSLLNNVGLGGNAVDAITSGSYNTGAGVWALTSVTTGNSNTSVGWGSFDSVSTTNGNTGLGYRAGGGVTGNSNVAIGYQALYQQTNASGNVAIGNLSGNSSSTLATTNNVLVGTGTGVNLDGAINNIIIGQSSGGDIIAGDNNILIGSNAEAGGIDASNYLNIGNVITGDLASGNVAIGTSSPSSKLDVEGKITVGPINTTAGNAGAIAFEELAANGTNSVTMRSPDSLAADYTLTMPADDGDNGEVLTTDGSGVLTWAAAPAATSVSAGAGSAGAPSIAFSTDTDTGIFSGGADIMSFAVGGAEIFSFSSNGIVSPTTGGGSVSTANGTATAPTFSFAGDADTGWFRPAADTLAAATGGAERVRIDSTGNVGIGTTNPSAKLQVSTNSSNLYTSLSTTVANPAIDSGLVLNNTGSSTAGTGTYIGFLAQRDDSTHSIAYMGALSVNGSDAAPLVFGQRSAAASFEEKMRIDFNGNIGIGTTAPDKALHIRRSSTTGFEKQLLLETDDGIAGTAAAGMSFRVAAADDDFEKAGIAFQRTVAASARGKLHFLVNGVDDSSNVTLADSKLSIDYTGNVGIGTTAPLADLDIGDVSVGYPGLKISGKSDNELDIAVPTGEAIQLGHHDGTSNGGTTRLAIDLSGNVGIGTTSPTSPLTIGNYIFFGEGAGVATAGSDIRLSSQGVISSGDSMLINIDGDNDSTTNFFSINKDSLTNTTTELFRVQENGNVGIGTNDPQDKLHISAAAPNIQLTDTDTGADHEIAGNSTLGTLYIRADTNNEVANSDIAFEINGTSVLHLEEGGNIGIGTTSPTYPLDVEASRTSYVTSFINTNTATGTDGIIVQAGETANPGTGTIFVRFRDGDGTDIAGIRGDGAGGVTYSTTSDRRLKDNIHDTKFGLKDLMKVRVRDYNYKTSDVTTTGVVAQELYKIYKPAVNKPENEDEDVWTVGYGMLTPLIISGVQEMNSNIDKNLKMMKLMENGVETNTRKIASLEKENREIKAQLNMMKSYLCSKEPKAPFCN